MSTTETTRTFDDVAIPTPGTFSLDPAHTTVGFVARHMMVSKVRGSFGEVTGTITVAGEPLQSSVEARIKAASIDTGHPDRDNHLRSGDFLNTDEYPELAFHSLRIEGHHGAEFTLVGELTIRGVTREVKLAVEFEGMAKSPWGQEVIGFTATGEIDREEFGVMWNQALETGGVMVGRKVRLEISAEAVRQA